MAIKQHSAPSPAAERVGYPWRLRSSRCEMADEDSDALFVLTKRVREAVSLINSLDEGRLAVVVKRLARAVGGRYGESAASQGPHLSESFELRCPPSRKNLASSQPAGAAGALC